MLLFLLVMKSLTALDSGSLKALSPLYSSLQVLLLLPDKNVVVKTEKNILYLFLRIYN